MADSCDRATADSAFFTVLPAEVRVSILTAAFGDRTVHIQQCQPAAPRSQGQGARLKGAVGDARQWLGGLLASTKTKEKRKETRPAGCRKQWFGCTCYCLPDVALDTSPAADTCLADLARAKSPIGASWSCVDPPEVPPELAVGAIGWLLTCRKAYNEGVEVLYATKTFHVRTADLRVLGGFIPQIPAIGLSYITSVEFVLDRRFMVHKDLVALPKADGSEADMLESTLSRIPRLMPSLKKLYLGFCPNTCLLSECAVPHALGYDCAKYFVGLMEAMARQMGQMGRSFDLELGLPSTPFDLYHDEALMKRCRMGLPNWKPGMPDQISYYSRKRLFWPVQNQRPHSESGMDEGGEPDIGYWMSESQFDPRGYYLQRCFGT